MDPTTAQILLVAHTEEDNLNVLTAFIDGEEKSSVQVCDVDRLDSVITTLFRGALAADVPFLVVVATARNRATPPEHFLTLNIQNVLRRFVNEEIPATLPAEMGAELVEIDNVLFFPRVEKYSLPWMPKPVVARFNALVEKFRQQKPVELLPVTRSNHAQWANA